MKEAEARASVAVHNLFHDAASLDFDRKGLSGAARSGPGPGGVTTTALGSNPGPPFACGERGRTAIMGLAAVVVVISRRRKAGHVGGRGQGQSQGRGKLELELELVLELGKAVGHSHVESIPYSYVLLVIM